MTHICGVFPWRCHRTWAEVADTEALKTQTLDKHPNLKKLTPEERRLLLEELTAKERAHNPPPPQSSDKPA